MVLVSRDYLAAVGWVLAALVSLPLLSALQWSTGNCPHWSDPTDNYSRQHTSQVLFYVKMKFIFLLSTVGVSESKNFLESTLKAWNSKPSNL